MNYKKICNISLDLDLESLKGNPGKNYIGLGTGKLQYYWSNDYKEIFDKIPKFTSIPPERAFIAEIDGSGSIGPHIDHGPRVVLNWYLRTNSASTLFYRRKENAVPFTALGEDDSNLYRPEDIEIVDSFTARDNDVFLLDVSQVHSVSSPKPGSRLFLSLSWSKQSFDEILEDIRLNFKGN